MTRQGLMGLTFASFVILAWLCLHVWSVFGYRWTAVGLALAPFLILTQAWLGTAMFIVAHDAIHGSLAPGRPSLNASVGQLAVGLYAGFSYSKLSSAHRRHHAEPGTRLDPDFHADAPDRLIPWLTAFFRQHFGWAEFARVTAVLVIYLVLGAQLPNLVAFWAVPAGLSALQLFYFGTFLPHRHTGEPFVDQHRARSQAQSTAMSFLTCLNFGACHHEHHLRPDLPWWRLPQARRPTGGTTGADAPAAE